MWKTLSFTLLYQIATVLPAGVFNREFRNVKQTNQAALRPLLNQCLHVASTVTPPKGHLILSDVLSYSIILFYLQILKTLKIYQEGK